MSLSTLDILPVGLGSGLMMMMMIQYADDNDVDGWFDIRRPICTLSPMNRLFMDDDDEDDHNADDDVDDDDDDNDNDDDG